MDTTSNEANTVQDLNAPPPPLIPSPPPLSPASLSLLHADLSSTSLLLCGARDSLPGEVMAWCWWCWWRIVLLMSIFRHYRSAMLDCPPSCICSPEEVFCNRSDSDRFFPLLAVQQPASNGSTGDMEDLFTNITSM